MRPISKKIAVSVAVLAFVTVLLVLAGRGKPVAVKVVELRPGDMRVIVNATTTSTVKSENEVTLSAQRTGRVTFLPVQEGDRVKKGQVIARLDLTEEEVQSASALAESKATYEELQKNLERSEDLFAKGMIAQQDLDGARRAYAVAKSRFEASRDDVRVKKDYSIIQAPFDGVVAKKFTEVGELLLPGKQIVTIVDAAKIYVLATIDEADVGRLRLGLPVTITVDAFPGEKFAGTVRRISPIVSGGKLETRTADVWIYFAKKDARLKPGMSADVEILVAVRKDVLAVPSQAVIERDGKKQVYVVGAKAADRGGTATVRLRPVETGESNWISTEIRKGLSKGDLIVSTPDAEGLKDGVKVRFEPDRDIR